MNTETKQIIENILLWMTGSKNTNRLVTMIGANKFVFDQLSGGVRLVRLDPNLNISSLISTKQFGTDEEVWETLKSQASGQEL